jgi:hypothetical protein
VKSTRNIAKACTAPKVGRFATLHSLLRVPGTTAPKIATGSGTSSSRVAWLSLPALLLASLALTAAPALANVHAFSKTFGEPCTTTPCGPGQFNEPAGVAVNDTTGNVYVIDKGDKRVEEFSAEGVFIAEFNGMHLSAEGSGTLKAGETTIESVLTTTGAFNAGAEISGAGIPAGTTITGAPGGGILEISQPVEAGKSGLSVALTAHQSLSEPEQIAVDNSGSASDPSKEDVYVTDRGTGVVDKFSAGGAYLGQVATGAGGAPLEGLNGVAVDPRGVVWVYQESLQIAAFSDAEPNVFLSTRTSGAEKNAYPDFAVDSEDNFYVAHKKVPGGAHVVAKLNSTGAALTQELGGEGNTGIAVDLANNDVYLDTSGENLNGENITQIEQLAASGTSIESFGSEQLGDGGGRGVAVNSTAAGPSSQAVYVADAVADDVAIYPSHVLPVIVEGESVSFVQSTSATFEAEINPGASEAPYHFEYGPAAGSYDVSVPIPDAHTSLSRAGVKVSALAKGLAPGTTYHYRVLAVNSLGEDVDGPDKTFTTHSEPGSEPPQNCPNEQRRTEQPFGLKLPDCRAYEMVSPVETGGADATVAENRVGPRAAVSGEAVTYASRGSFAKPAGATVENQMLSRRNAANDRWETQSITPLRDVFTTEIQAAYEGMAFTPELTEGIAQTNAPLVPGAPGGKGELEFGMYLADFATGTYRYIAPNSPFQLFGASTDLSRVMLQSSEWSDGNTVPVMLTNEGEPIDGAVGEPLYGNLLSVDKDAWQAVSGDGSRVYFTSPGNQKDPGVAQLYVRVNVGQPQSPIAEPEASGRGTLTEHSNVITSLVTAMGTTVGELPEGQTTLGVFPSGGKFVVGDAISGPPGAIASGTKITEITEGSLFGGSYLQLHLSAATTGRMEPGEPISAVGPAPFTVGQKIAGDGIPSGTTIEKAEAGTLTLSQRAASSGSEVALNAGGECTVPTDACTINVSSSQRLSSNPAGVRPVRYWGASADGSRVFFSSSAELTEDAYTGPGGSGANLYEYDLATGKLNDLTGEATDKTGDGAAVQGVVQISEEGQYVYFVAKGALTGPHGEALQNSLGDEPVAEEDNLYVSHEGGAPRFITTLAAGDSSDWDNDQPQSTNEAGPEVNTAVVDPSGTRLAFMSSSELKTVNFPQGYDNTDAGSGQLDAEVFLYDAETGGTSCASCDPTGARPVGPSSLGRRQVAAAEYRARNLLDNGELFFNSSDALVPHASDGRQNVYEYENGHTYAISNVAGGFESFFVDASAKPGEEGVNVFFATSDQLLPEDTSGNAVVYDARVGGGFPVTVAAPACTTAEACRVASGSAPAVFGAPPSATFSGPGNYPAAVSPPPPKKAITKKTVKCKKGDTKNKKGKCVPKKKKKAKKAQKSAHTNRRTH